MDNSISLRVLRIAALAAILPFSLQAEDAPSIESPVELRITPAKTLSETEVRATAGPRTIVSEFFETLGIGKVDLAYKNLTAGSTIQENPGQISMLRTKTDQAITEFGRIEGEELVEMEWAGAHLVRLTYLSLGEKFPLRWRFYFYERKGTWRLVDIRVDDRLKELFGEDSDSKTAP